MTWDVFDPNRDYVNDLQVVTHVLERHELRTRRKLGLLDVKLARVPDFVEREAGRMVYEMSAYVWSQTLQDETVVLSVEYPDGAWQAFKRRWFPAWALRRWPVRNATVEQRHRFRTIGLLPDFNKRAPDGCGEYVLKTIVERR